MPSRCYHSQRLGCKDLDVVPWCQLNGLDDGVMIYIEENPFHLEAYHPKGESTNTSSLNNHRRSQTEDFIFTYQVSIFHSIIKFG